MVCVDILKIWEFALIKKIQKTQIMIGFNQCDNPLSQ